MKNVQKIILYLTSVLLLGCLGWIFIHAVCAVPQAKNIFKDKNMLPVIVAGTLFLLLLFLKLSVISRSWQKHTLLRGTVVVFLMILILQFLYLYYVRYWVGYDNLLVLDEAWHMQKTGHISPDFYDSYFQRYPHNHPIVIVLYWALWAAGKLGIADLYWTPHLLGLVCMDTALVFMWKLTCETADVHRGFLLAVLSLLNPVIYIWMPWHYTTVSLLPFLLMCGMTWTLTGAVRNHYADFDSSDKEFPPVHFVMMGVGEDGTYKKQDVEFTEAISGEKEKTRANLQETEKRIRDLGGAGLLSLAGRKMLITWQDGSCGFQSEWLYPLKDSRIFQYICVERNDPFLCWAQIFYVLVLFLTIWGTISDMRNGRTGVGLLMRLLLLGNILFYLGWEAQNRYSIGMNGVLLFLAADALDGLCAEKAKTAGRSLQKLAEKKNVWRIMTGTMAVILVVLLYRPLFTEETSWREFSVRNIYRAGKNLENIVSGERVTQTFTASSAFDCILVQGYLKNGEVSDGGCQVEIQDETGKTLVSTFLTAQQIAENQLDLSFEPVVPEKETVYTIVIEPRGIRKDHALQLYRFNSSMDLYPNGKLSRNGKEENGNLIFSVYQIKTGTIFRRNFGK